MDKPVRVSVLIYIHNSEKYLLDCLKSLSNQILDDLEIICINDGSNDDSEDILENFIKQEPRLRVINLKKSVGFGRVMNQGIKQSRGEYIGLIEPSDYVDPEMYIELFALAKKYDADVAKSNYFEHIKEKDGEKNHVKDIVLPEETGAIINPLEDTRIFYQTPAIWSAIYRKDFLLKEKITFPETSSTSYQDISFNYEVLSSGGKIILTDKPYLHHRIDNSSQPRGKKPRRKKEQEQQIAAESLFVINDEFRNVEEYLKKRNTWSTYCYVFQAVKFATYHWYLLNLPSNAVEDFARRMRAEFHDADNKKLLRKPYFPKNHWRMLRVLLDTSDTAFLLIFKSYSKKKKH